MATSRVAAVFGIAVSATLAVARAPVRHPWTSKTDPASPFKDGAYSGPFLQITANGLPVANVADGFGPEDKMVTCRNKLVFIDLDLDGGTWFWFDLATWTPTKGPITMDGSCAGIPLFPRSSGYTIGLTTEPGSSSDRILLVGGDANESNIYYSSSCGQSWMCMEDPELWRPRDYSAIIPTTGVIPNEPVLLAGGRSFVGYRANRDMFLSYDGGYSWSRPECTDPSNCGRGCSYGCTLTTPDRNGSCSAANPNYEACYFLPDFPVYPGSLATDWDSLWLFMATDQDGETWVLNGTTFATAW